MKDTLLSMGFLSDSSSTVNIISLFYVDNEDPATSCNLFALNLTEVKTYNKRKLMIDNQREIK